MSARPWRHITGLHHPRTEDTWLHLHDETCGQGVTTMLYPFEKLNSDSPMALLYKLEDFLQPRLPLDVKSRR